MQTFVNTIRSALNSVNPDVPFVDSSPSNQIEATDPYTKRYSPHSRISKIFSADHVIPAVICCSQHVIRLQASYNSSGSYSAFCLVI